MKKLFTLLLAGFAITLYAQTTATIKQNEEYVNEAYEIIKDYRNNVNLWAERPNNPYNLDTSEFKNLYKELYNGIVGISPNSDISISYKKIDPSFFNSEVVISEPLNPEKITFSEFFAIVKLFNDSTTELYESRVFGIEFPTLNTSLPEEFDYLVEDYKKALESVGRRMGRLIQMAIFEKDDYVTPTSFTRLNMALTDYRTAEHNLLFALENQLSQEETPDFRIDSIESKVTNLEYQLLLKKESPSFYITAISDLKSSVGAGIYYAHRYGFGADILAGFNETGDFIIHPKVGMGQGLFHFAVGGWYSTVDDLLEFTGNVFVMNDKMMGGVGFSKNHVTINFGWKIGEGKRKK